MASSLSVSMSRSGSTALCSAACLPALPWNCVSLRPQPTLTGTASPRSSTRSGVSPRGTNSRVIMTTLALPVIRATNSPSGDQAMASTPSSTTPISSTVALTSPW